MTDIVAEPRPTSNAPTVGGIVLGFGLLVPAVVVLTTPDTAKASWTPGLLSCVLASILLARSLASGVRPYTMSVAVYLYVFLGLAPLVQLRTEKFPLPGIASQASGASLIVCLGSVALLLGVWVVDRGAPSEPVAATSRADYEAQQQMRLRALAVLALAASGYYLVTLGVGTLLSDRATLAAARTSAFGGSSVSALVGGVCTAPLLVAAVGFILRRRTPGVRLGGADRLLLGLLLFTVAITYNPFGNARYSFGTGVLALAAAAGGLRDVRRLRVMAVAIIAGFVLVFPFADLARTATSSTAQQNRDPLSVLQTGDYDSFSQIANARNYVSTEGQTAGRQLAGVVLFWVPRTIWSDKPVDTGVLLANSRGYSFTNLSAPLPAEFFVNFGWPGLLVGMAGLGVVLARADQRVGVRMAQFSRPSVRTAVLPFYLVIVLRGSLLQATAGFVIILVTTRIVDGPADSR